MLFLLKMSPPWSYSSWNHSAMKMGKMCNKIRIRIFVLLISPHQRLKSKVFEKFSLLLWGCCLVVKKFQKTLISAFEAILISDSTNNSLNCTFFEFLKYFASWC
jgi:hypothetical protein